MKTEATMKTEVDAPFKNSLLNDSHVLLKGWMTKSPPASKLKTKGDWRRRYFTLLKMTTDQTYPTINNASQKHYFRRLSTEADIKYCLVYWKHDVQADTKPIRAIPLKDSTVTKHSDMTWDQCFTHMIKLTTPKRAYIFCCDDQESYDSWCEALNDAIQSCRETPVYQTLDGTRRPLSNFGNDYKTRRDSGYSETSNTSICSNTHLYENPGTSAAGVHLQRVDSIVVTTTELFDEIIEESDEKSYDEEDDDGYIKEMDEADEEEEEDAYVAMSGDTSMLTKTEDYYAFIPCQPSIYAEIPGGCSGFDPATRRHTIDGAAFPVHIEVPPNLPPPIPPRSPRMSPRPAPFCWKSMLPRPELDQLCPINDFIETADSNGDENVGENVYASVTFRPICAADDKPDEYYVELNRNVNSEDELESSKNNLLTVADSNQGIKLFKVKERRPTGIIIRRTRSADSPILHNTKTPSSNNEEEFSIRNDNGNIQRRSRRNSTLVVRSTRTSVSNSPNEEQNNNSNDENETKGIQDTVISRVRIEYLPLKDINLNSEMKVSATSPKSNTELVSLKNISFGPFPI